MSFLSSSYKIHFLKSRIEPIARLDKCSHLLTKVQSIACFIKKFSLKNLQISYSVSSFLLGNLFFLIDPAYASSDKAIILPPSQSALSSTPHQEKEPIIKQLLLDNTKYRSDTIAFYKENQYQPVWLTGNQLSPAAHIALDVLKNVEIEGLNPEAYQEAQKAIAKGLSVEAIDLALTNDFIHFIDDVRVGRIPPSHSARIIKITSPGTTPLLLLQAALKDPEKLRHMAPEMADYQDLKQALATYKLLQAQGRENPDNVLPTITAKILKLGIQDPDVSKLRRLLHLLGDKKVTNLKSTTFDKELEHAVKRFQKHHFISPTGVVSDLTRKALNTPLTERIDKIIINMERLRWLPDDHLTKKYLFVNVAGYEVKAYTGNHLNFRMKAIVGKTTTKTPLFYAPLKNIVINPSWGVPHSILMRDKLSKILHDPDYVQRAGFTIYDENNQVIEPDEADWANEGSHYRLRQSPGANNALGRIKLNIDNPYTIYLHGTPNEKLFNKIVRNDSSGCIRLQNPVAMASWTLDNPEKYSVAHLEKLIKKGKTLSVSLKNKINVYFTYQTVWKGDDGEFYFSPDAYKLDPTLEKLLKVNPKDAPEPESSKIRIT